MEVDGKSVECLPSTILFDAVYCTGKGFSPTDILIFTYR